MRHARAWVAAVLLALGCGGSGTAPQSQPTAYLRILNTAQGGQFLAATVDGHDAVLALAPGTLSEDVPLAPGMHAISLRAAGGIPRVPISRNVNFALGDTVTLLAVDSGSVITPWNLTDSGRVVAAGKTKLRVVNFVGSGVKVLFYRTQPDSPTPTSVMFPFPFPGVSPYLESTPGSWTVLMATEHYTADGHPLQADTLATSGSVDIPAGESRTVVFMNSATGGFVVTTIKP